MKKITLLMLLIFITTITLHGQNKLLSSTKENYNGGNWQNSYGTNYEYDSNNNLISETELSWNSFSSVWENTSKTTYIYNEKIRLHKNCIKIGAQQPIRGITHTNPATFIPTEE